MLVNKVQEISPKIMRQEVYAFILLIFTYLLLLVDLDKHDKIAIVKLLKTELTDTKKLEKAQNIALITVF